ADEADFLSRFQQEAQMVAQLSHPNILPIYDYGREGDIPYIVMPLVAGGTLRDLLAQLPSPERALPICDRILSALAYAHAQHVVPRAVKPANVLMGDDDWPLLTDFGIAKIVAPALTATYPGTMIGTPGYMAPEQAEGKPIDHRADLYAMGVILFEMLAGRPAFGNRTLLQMVMSNESVTLPSLRTIRPELSPAWDDV